MKNTAEAYNMFDIELGAQLLTQPGFSFRDVHSLVVGSALARHPSLIMNHAYEPLEQCCALLDGKQFSFFNKKYKNLESFLDWNLADKSKQEKFYLLRESLAGYVIDQNEWSEMLEKPYVQLSYRIGQKRATGGVVFQGLPNNFGYNWSKKDNQRYASMILKKLGDWKKAAKSKESVPVALATSRYDPEARAQEIKRDTARYFVGDVEFTEDQLYNIASGRPVDYQEELVS